MIKAAMFPRRALAVSAMLAAFFLTGCAGQSSATLSPGADLSKFKTAYVVKQPKDKRDIDDLIKTNLERRGYTVTKGAELPGAYPADVAVTYEDRWMWDITTYMIELTIHVRDAKSKFPLASGNAMHMSLTRKSPEGMVDEVLTNIFTAKK